ncbi:MAG: hypothetical protein ACFFE8_15720, partial [Candidatus Heimdallarchaeota archaeon]
MSEKRIDILNRIATGELSPEKGEKLLREIDKEKPKRFFYSDTGLYVPGIIPSRELDKIIARILPNVSSGFLEELQSFNGSVSYKELKKLALKYVSPEYLDSLSDLGYDKHSDDHLA